METLFKSAPNESAKSNWGLQAQAVVAVLEKKSLNQGCEKGQAIASMLGLDERVAQENVPKISMEGWENLELALQAYLQEHPESGAFNLDDSL